MDRIFIALAALGGGLLAALLGWVESSEPFDGRKFSGSVIRTLIAAVLFAAGYQFTQTPVAVIDLFLAFLGGAGADAISNRIAGSFGQASWPIPPAKDSG